MPLFKSAKGNTLDRIADMYWMRRKVICSIPLLRGWKLVEGRSIRRYTDPGKTCFGGRDRQAAVK